MVARLETWTQTIWDITKRAYDAMPVKDRAVKMLEHIRDELSWSAGTLRMAVGNGEL